MTEYQIEFSIRLREDGEADFAEIGYSATCAWESIDECAHEVMTMIQNRVWDTEQDIEQHDAD